MVLVIVPLIHSVLFSYNCDTWSGFFFSFLVPCKPLCELCLAEKQQNSGEDKEQVES